jgi:hypothetical protein
MTELLLLPLCKIVSVLVLFDTTDILPEPIVGFPIDGILLDDELFTGKGGIQFE